jgi:uracil-DNA glycosylase
MSGDSVENKENQLENELIDQMKDILPKFYFNDLLGESWSNVLYQEFSKDYMIKLGAFLEEERKTKDIYPEKDKVFERFKLCKFEDIKVLIIKESIEYDNHINEEWFKQGIFVLPKILTRENGNILAHQNKGWETFFDFILYSLLNNNDKKTYILDGKQPINCVEASKFVKDTYNIDLKW